MTGWKDDLLPPGSGRPEPWKPAAALKLWGEHVGLSDATVTAFDAAAEFEGDECHVNPDICGLLCVHVTREICRAGRERAARERVPSGIT